MWVDAFLTLSGVPARWTVVVIDRDTCDEYPIASVRFRWRRSADTWSARAPRMSGRRMPTSLRAYALTATYAVRALEAVP